MAGPDATALTRVQRPGPDPDGLRLHDAMLAWLFEQGVDRVWQSTEASIGAQRFYERAGWRSTGPLGSRGGGL